MFLGRKYELDELNNLYNKKGFKFIVIYGRRRVGKTALIKEFIQHKDSIFYISIEQNNKAALDSFSSKILERFPMESKIINNFESWDKAFEYLAKQVDKNRIILVIDEYPYLAGSDPSISSVLQKHIDTDFQATNLFLILCGSSMSFMENQVLGYKSPLYGRRTSQFHIIPFDYYDSGLFFPEFSFEDKMIAYAVTGGIPQYLNVLAEYDDVMIGITECFLKKSGILYEEPENLLKQELHEPYVYNTIIESIATGSSKLNEISTKSGEDIKKCSMYLKSLVDLYIVRKEYPYGVKAEKNSIYALQDNMFRFWYRFIPKNVTNIELGLGEYVLKARILPHMANFVGHIFEEACCQYVLRRNKTLSLPFMINDIGRWWGTNNQTHTQEEIDFIADCDESAIFGECKWLNTEIGLDIFEELKRKSMLFGKYINKYYMLFSKKGFTKGLTNLDYVELIGLEELYKEL
ncbi:MAG: ATP-binding protein [Oscillospiraceae bacterium]|nr:ATP-binding protein [Oscillospiraceae bacterium]